MVGTDYRYQCLLTILNYAVQDDEPRKLVVVCPKGMNFEWERSLEDFPSLKFQHKVIDINGWSELLTGQRHYILIDEVHPILEHKTGLMSETLRSIGHVVFKWPVEGPGVLALGLPRHFAQRF